MCSQHDSPPYEEETPEQAFLRYVSEETNYDESKVPPGIARVESIKPLPDWTVAVLLDLQTRCERCGEPFKDTDERAEVAAMIIHASCMKEGETVA